MTITLFYSHFCPPARSALLIAKALKLKLKIEEVDLLSESYKLTPFKRQHPEKTVPCLKDGNNFVWDSHAIAGYLVNQYGVKSNLIPRNIIQKAEVDRLLHFDSEYLTPLACDALVPVLFQRNHLISKSLKKSVGDVYSILDKQLHNSKWLIGNDITIADLCCISSISTLDLVIPIEENSTLFGYVKNFKELPYYQEGNQEGLNIMAELVLNKIISYKYGYIL
ncbi:glutathione S-transferase 1-like [Coccinella septempunctata]|uniref:glutathione S-transferase 1-like n=1 Tax=Coccinella septempunctata TaxID=41139 RepID=UPI001D086C16|nr:glutathione S-transferase 1-like [Coccinella septempunctata]